MDFGHHNIQRISKALTLNANNTIDDPCISVWNKTTLTLLKSKKPEYYNVICTVIDRMGEASAKAQALPTAITTSSKIQFNDNNLYLYSVENKGYGILKVGRKKLFYRNMTGDFKEIEPLCVLDFYVSEAVQRKGIGKILIEAMLAFEKTSPERMAYDRPSPKLLGFLKRHYGLADFIPQSNNFVVFKQYFMSGSPSLVSTVRSPNEATSRPTKRNGNDSSEISPIMLNTIDSRALNQQEQSPPAKYSQNDHAQTNCSSPQQKYYSPQNIFPNYRQHNQSPIHQNKNRSPQNQTAQWRNNQSPNQNSPISQSNFSTPPPFYGNPSSSQNNHQHVYRSPSSQSTPQNFYTTTTQSHFSQNSFTSPSPNKRFVQYNPITHECAEIERNGDARKTGKKVSSQLSGY